MLSTCMRGQTGPERAHTGFGLHGAALGGFGERVDAFSGEAQIAPGVTAYPLPGHTVGHSGLMVESDGQMLLIAADIVHVPAVQLARPDVTIGFDTDQDQARATRIKETRIKETRIKD